MHSNSKNFEGLIFSFRSFRYRLHDSFYSIIKQKQYSDLPIFANIHVRRKKKKKRSEILKTRFPRFPHIFTNGSLTSSLNEIIPPRSKHYSAISQFVSPFLEFSLNRRIRLRDRAQDSRLTKVTNMQNVVSSRSVVDDLVEMMFVVRFGWKIRGRPRN